MTEAPICPVHGLPMRKFDFGWKCTKKLADGWCNQRVKFDTPQAQGPSTARPAQAVGHARQACARASMDFVASIYQGHGSNIAANELTAFVAIVYNACLPLFEDKP